MDKKEFWQLRLQAVWQEAKKAAQVVEHLKTVLKDPGSNPTDGWPFFFDFTLESSH